MENGSSQRTTGRLLLVVEDDPTQRAALAATVRRLGFRVTTASDAEEGCRALESNEPDLVLCDYEIPGGGGLTVLELVRDHSNHLPFVLMTSHRDPEVRREAFTRGATIFLSKPLTISKIDEAIREALGGRVEKHESQSV